MTIDQAYKKLEECGLAGWCVVRNDRLKVTAGRCTPSYRTIELAGWLIDHNTDKEIEQTLVHEIAHALVPGGHTAAWSRKCKELGGDGLPYYNIGDRKVNNPNLYSGRRYAIHCAACGFDFHGVMERRRRSNMVHKIDGGHIIYTRVQ